MQALWKSIWIFIGTNLMLAILLVIYALFTSKESDLGIKKRFRFEGDYEKYIPSNLIVMRFSKTSYFEKNPSEAARAVQRWQKKLLPKIASPHLPQNYRIEEEMLHSDIGLAVGFKSQASIEAAFSSVSDLQSTLALALEHDSNTIELVSFQPTKGNLEKAEIEVHKQALASAHDSARSFMTYWGIALKPCEESKRQNLSIQPGDLSLSGGLTTQEIPLTKIHKVPIKQFIRPLSELVVSQASDGRPVKLPPALDVQQILVRQSATVWYCS